MTQIFMDNFGTIVDLLQNTLNFQNRKQAESKLLELEKTMPSFACVLLNIIKEQQNIPAVLYLKNYIKKNWGPDSDLVIPSEHKNWIRNQILPLMFHLQKRNVQIQLSEAIVNIAEYDFPDHWPDLIPTMVATLSPNDYSINNGVLQTAHSIFKRWRGQFRSEKLFLEIKMVLEQFSLPFLNLLKSCDSLIDSNGLNKDVLQVLLQTMLLLTKIFHSFICQDLPEFIEDHQDEFMTILHKYLVYQNDLVRSDDEPGLLENIKTSICEIIDIYAKRYEDDFPKLSVFVETIWTLLTTTSLETKNDLLVSKALGFLTSIVKLERHKAIFASSDTLNLICQRIIIPNMFLRETDEEMFEDDSIEFIRRDLEGSDTDSRRRAASDLVRGLLEQFSEQVTQIFGDYVNQYLQDYEKDRKANWKSKDTALYLLTAICARESAIQSGAIKVNELVPLNPVFASHILPELSSPVNSVHPIIKVDVIKFVLLFRSLLPDLSSLIPLLIEHMNSSNFVVYTYAAVCIERMLTCKNAQGKHLFSQEQMKPYAQPLLGQLFKLMSKCGESPLKLAENEYIIKAIMRVIALSREEILPFANDIISQLGRVIKIISQNPSNPKFNHYVFESLAALIRFIPGRNPTYLGKFEDVLQPLIHFILEQDVAEFTPYALQILSQLLYLHQGTAIPPSYQALLPPLLQPGPWENHGNIPALVSLMQAYVLKGSDYIVQANLLPAFLGIFQKLVSSRMNDHHGFDLLVVIFGSIPSEALFPYAKNIFGLLLTRLTSASKTARFIRGFLMTFCNLLLMQKPGFTGDELIRLFETFQPQLFSQMMKGALLPEFGQISSLENIRLGSVGLLSLCAQSQLMTQESNVTLINDIVSAVAKHLKVHRPPTEKREDEEMYLLDIEEAGYQASYSKLAAASKPVVDRTKNMPSTRDMLQKVVEVRSQFICAETLELLRQI